MPELLNAFVLNIRFYIF